MNGTQNTKKQSLRAIVKDLKKRIELMESQIKAYDSWKILEEELKKYPKVIPQNPYTPYTPPDFPSQGYTCLTCGQYVLYGSFHNCLGGSGPICYCNGK